jgi:hypothetical protein
MGEIEKSRAAYKKLFELWKDADPALKVVIQAKGEYNTLSKATYLGSS